jgi:hypothetical protein
MDAKLQSDHSNIIPKAVISLSPFDSAGPFPAPPAATSLLIKCLVAICLVYDLKFRLAIFSLYEAKNKHAHVWFLSLFSYKIIRGRQNEISIRQSGKRFFGAKK